MTEKTECQCNTIHFETTERRWVQFPFPICRGTDANMCAERQYAEGRMTKFQKHVDNYHENDMMLTS